VLLLQIVLNITRIGTKTVATFRIITWYLLHKPGSRYCHL